FADGHPEVRGRGKGRRTGGGACIGLLNLNPLLQTAKYAKYADGNQMGQKQDLEPVLKMGGAGDPPAPVGDPPTGTAASNIAMRRSPLARTVAPVPSGESPDGTGGSPVLPANHFSNTLLLIRLGAYVFFFRVFSVFRGYLVVPLRETHE